MKKIIFLVLSLILMTILNAEKAPSFTIETMDGKMIKLETILGQGPLFLDFWATWCQPCLNSMPIWSKYSEKYPRMQFYAISIDKPRDKKKAEQMVKSKKYAFNVGYDGSGDLTNLFGIKDVPRLFIIDQSGEIIFEHRGFTAGDETEVEEMIIKALGN